MADRQMGHWLPSVGRRAIFVPFGATFVLGVSMILFGLSFGAGELAWVDAREGEARVVDKYVRPSQEHSKLVVDSRIAYEIDTGRGGIVRGDLWYPVYMGWEGIRVGDRIDLQYRENGEARLPQDGGVQGWLGLARYGVPLAIVGGGVAMAMVILEFRSGRLTWRTVWAALSGAA